MSKKLIYCSSCHHSRYACIKGDNVLQCTKCRNALVSKYIPTNSTFATKCLFFKKENINQVELRTKKEWKQELERCGISTVIPYHPDFDQPFGGMR